MIFSYALMLFISYSFYPPQGGSIRGFFVVGYFIKYGQYRSIKVNHSQLRLIKVK